MESLVMNEDGKAVMSHLIKSDEETSVLISKSLFIKAIKELLTQNFHVKIFVGGNLEFTVQN